MMINPPHPGELLREDVIVELGLSVKETADRLMDAGRWSDFGIDLAGAPQLNLAALNARKARIVDAQRGQIEHVEW